MESPHLNLLKSKLMQDLYTSNSHPHSTPAPEEQHASEAPWHDIVNATRPSPAQRRFNAIQTIEPNFVRGEFKPRDAKELRQAVELAIAAWPLRSAGHVFFGVSNLAVYSPSRGAFDTGELEPKTGEELLAYIKRRLQLRKDDASKRRRRTRLDNEVGLHWLAQSGARFGDVIEVSTRQYKVQ